MQDFRDLYDTLATDALATALIDEFETKVSKCTSHIQT